MLKEHNHAYLKILELAHHLVMIFLFKIESLRCRAGILTGVFVLGYGIARIGVEFFREPDSHIGYLSFGFTTGQYLSVPLVIMGLWLVLWSGKKS